MNKIIIIAEIGVNHNGKLTTAMRLIDLACEAKVDYVKFQSFITEDLLTENSKLAKYQEKNFLGTQNELLKKYELSFNEQIKLYNYCKKKKIGYLSTPFDYKSLIFIEKKVPFIKVSSGDLDNIPFLKQIAKTKKKILLSTGMSDALEIKKALTELFDCGVKKKNITLLHCHTDYPTEFRDVNLNSILYLKKRFGLSIGFSDHTIGIEASIAAAALGAEVIEKHFTISKKMKGPDHSSSIDFKELALMVKSIRNIEIGMGRFGKYISNREKKNKIKVRKSIVASTYIKKGSLFSQKNLITKRPGNGISAIHWNKILGKIAKKNFYKNEKIKI